MAEEEQAGEISRLLKSFRTRSRLVDEVRWVDEHVAKRAVVVETARSVYIFVPQYKGRGSHVAGTFRFAGFDAMTRNDPPRILIGRPYNVSVGRPLEITIEKMQTKGRSGVEMVATDTRRTVATSRVERLRVMELD